MQHRPSPSSDASFAASGKLANGNSLGHLIGRVLRMIHSAKLKPHDQLPSENELAREFAVARSSVREVLLTGALESLGRAQALRLAQAGAHLVLVDRPKSLARELATHHIRVNVLAPGIVGAGMALRQWQSDPIYQARAQKAIPVGQLQEPSSVADGMLFLCTRSSDYMTGAQLLIDGGSSLYPMI